MAAAVAARSWQFGATCLNRDPLRRPQQAAEQAAEAV